MAFENKTADELYDIVVDGFEQEFNTTFRLLPKSFLRVLAKVISGVYLTLYKMAGWIFLQIFPSTADYTSVSLFGKRVNPLAAWGNLMGCDSRKAATKFEGSVSVEVLASGVVDADTQLKSTLTNKVYLVAEAVGVQPSQSPATLEIICAEAGTAGNLAAGDELKFVSPLGIVAENAAVSAISHEGTDEESVSSYRDRIVNRWRSQPQGGALADYRNWAAEVDGVYQTYIYTDEETAAGVIIYVCANEETTGSRIATPALLKEVGDACTYDPDTGEANRKPVTAVLDPLYDESYSNIHSVTEKTFDVTITGWTGDIELARSTLQSQISDYFKEREPYVRGLASDNERFDQISKNNVSAIVNDVAISYTCTFGSVSLSSWSQTIVEYELARGELAKLGTLTITGSDE